MRESIAHKLAVCDVCGFELAFPASQRVPDICPRCFSAGRVDGKAGPSGEVNPNVIDVPFTVVTDQPVSEKGLITVLSEKEVMEALDAAAKASKKK